MAEETTSKLQKGWLKTREGNKFAPATLVDNVFSMDGTPYDQTIKAYIAQTSANPNAQLAGVVKDVEALKQVDKELKQADSALAAKLANFNGDESNTLYIIDNSNRIIAKIDADGVTSVDFNIPNQTSLLETNKNLNDVSTKVSTIETNTKNFNGLDSDVLYIIDNSNRIIAKVDAAGVHSINFTSPSGNLNTLAGQITALGDRIENFNGSDSDTLYIIDDSQRIIAKVDAEGVHSINFKSSNWDLEAVGKTTNDNSVALNTLTTVTVPGLDERLDTAESDIDAIETKLTPISTSDSDKVFYIIDAAGRKIMQVDEAGIKSIDFSICDATGSITTQLSTRASQAELNELAKTVGDQGLVQIGHTKSIQTLLAWIGGVDTDGNPIEEDAPSLWQKINDIANGETFNSFLAVEGELSRIDGKVDTKASQADFNALSTTVGDNSLAIESHETNLEAINAVLNTTINPDSLSIIDSSNNIIAKINEEGVQTTNFHAIYDADSTAEDKGGSVVADKDIVAYENVKAEYGDVVSQKGSLNETIKLLGKPTAANYTSTVFTDLSNLDTKLGTLKDDIGNLSNIMNFLGVVTNKDIQDIDGDTVTLYNIVLTDGTTIQTTKFKNGDVIIQDETAKEFVFSGDRWVEFGDATGNAAAISGLDTRVGSLESWKTNTVTPTLSDYGTRIGDLESAKATNDTDITNIKTALDNDLSTTVNTRISAAKSEAATDATNKANTVKDAIINGETTYTNLKLAGDGIRNALASIPTIPNGFAKATAGGITVEAETKDDTLNFAAGANITLTANKDTDTITIAATDTNTTYNNGNGLDLNDTTFSIKLANGNEGAYLSVNSDGLKLTGVHNIATAVAAKAEQSTVNGIDGRVTDIEGVLGDISNGNEFHIIDSANNKILTANEAGTSSISFHAIYDEDSTAQDKGGNIIADKDVQSEAGSLNNTINLLGKSSKEAYNSTAFKDIESLETNVNNLGTTMTTVKTNLGWSGGTAPETVDKRISTALGTAQGYANTAESNAKTHTNESIEALINDAYYYKTLKTIEDVLGYDGANNPKDDTVLKEIDTLQNAVDNINAKFTAIGDNLTDLVNYRGDYTSEDAINAIATPQKGDIASLNKKFLYLYIDDTNKWKITSLTEEDVNNLITTAITSNVVNGAETYQDFKAVETALGNLDTKIDTKTPAYTERAKDLYKIQVDNLGNVSDVTKVTKTDITALGIPAEDTNTTYSNGNGLNLTDTTFSIKLADSNEGQYLSVNADGLELTGINDIATAVGNKLDKAQGAANSGKALVVNSAGNVAPGIAEKAQTADKLSGDVTLNFTGNDIKGSATFNEPGTVQVELSIEDDSHNHIIDNIDGLKTRLDNLDTKTGLATSTTPGLIQVTYVDETGTLLAPSTTREYLSLVREKDSGMVYIPLEAGGKDAKGYVTTTSDVTELTGYAPTPIFNGVPYYKESSSITSGTIEHSAEGKPEGVTISDNQISIVVDAYTKQQTLEKIQEKITEVNGGESAGEVKAELNSHIEASNERFSNIEASLPTKVDVAFKTIEVAGQSSVIAEAKEDTLTLAAGAGIALTTDSTTDKITISSTIVDTDTHYESKNIVGASNTATENAGVFSNGVFFNHIENGQVTSSNKIVGGGDTTVTANSNGEIAIHTSHYQGTNIVGASATAISNTAASGTVYLNHIENLTPTSSIQIKGGNDNTTVESDANGVITITATIPPAEEAITYSAGNGLQLTGTRFSAKIDDASEDYLSVSEAGLKVSGIDEAINTVKNSIPAQGFTAIVKPESYDPYTGVYGEAILADEYNTIEVISDESLSVTFTQNMLSLGQNFADTEDTELKDKKAYTAETVDDLVSGLSLNIQELYDLVDDAGEMAAAVDERTANLDASEDTDGNILYIIDNQNRVIAKFNDTGLVTTDVSLPNNNLTLINNGIFFDEYTDIEINF